MHNQSTRGILYLCLSVLIFSLQDAIIKQVSGGYALTQVVCMRSLVGVPILWFLVREEVGWATLLRVHWFPLAARGLIMLGAYTAYYMAFPVLPLADAVALYFTVPLFVTALAGPVLGEHIGWKVWAVGTRPSDRLQHPSASQSCTKATEANTACPTRPPSAPWRCPPR